jgi:hypothetical protein
VDSWFGDPTPVLSTPRLGDVCFAAAFELKRALSELKTAASTEERVMAVEAGHRKLRRAARAVLGTQTSDTSAAADADAERHLASGLAVRRVYADFRRALRRPEGESPEQVLSAMRYAASALGAIVAAPEYFVLRAADRAIVRRLHARVLAWGRHDRAVDIGLQVLDDVWTAADLLRGINRRQEVQAHDRALIAELLAGAVPDGGGFIAALEALYGLDDALDQLLLGVNGETDPETASVRARAILFRFA